VINQIDGFNHDRTVKVADRSGARTERRREPRQTGQSDRARHPGDLRRRIAPRQVNDPGSDPRTPDIVLKVNTGVIFTGGSKLSEHGGFNEDDVHTALLVSLDGMTPAVVKAAVTNQQVAPTVIQAPGLDPSDLQAVRPLALQMKLHAASVPR
jgi:hypothetical protein